MHSREQTKEDEHLGANDVCSVSSNRDRELVWTDCSINRGIKQRSPLEGDQVQHPQLIGEFFRREEGTPKHIHGVLQVGKTFRGSPFEWQ